MKRFNFVMILVMVIAILSLAVLSQKSPITASKSKAIQLTPDIGLEEKETCTTEFYNEFQDVFTSCIYYHNYTSW